MIYRVCNTLYFAVAINRKANGLFGSLAAVSEPTTVALLGVSMRGLLMVRRRVRLQSNGQMMYLTVGYLLRLVFLGHIHR